MNFLHWFQRQFRPEVFIDPMLKLREELRFAQHKLSIAELELERVTKAWDSELASNDEFHKHYENMAEFQRLASKIKAIQPVMEQLLEELQEVKSSKSLKD